MMIRRAAIQDLEQIMQIYARAVQYMHASGNPNQWVAGYPSRTLIEEDIARGVSYVVDRDSVIEAVFSYIEGEDPTYRQIGQGMWHTNGSYGTVHRLASAGRLRGVAGICFSWCAEQAKMHGCSSLRADTHQDNRIMQHLLQKNGFVYCGVIHLANGAPRLAFERAAVAPEGAYAESERNEPGRSICRDAECEWNESGNAAAETERRWQRIWHCIAHTWNRVCAAVLYLHQLGDGNSGGHFRNHSDHKK